MAIHVMIDIETLGLEPGCKILQIAAAANHAGLSEITVSASRDKQPVGLIEDPATVKWWMEQSPEVYEKVFFSNSSLAEALMEFNENIQELRIVADGPFYFWGNAASFDLKILAYTYKLLGMQVPWTYKEEMCFRTFKNLYAKRWESLSIKPPSDVAHTAIGDARHQLDQLLHVIELERLEF